MLCADTLSFIAILEKTKRSLKNMERKLIMPAIRCNFTKDNQLKAKEAVNLTWEERNKTIVNKIIAACVNNEFEVQLNLFKREMKSLEQLGYDILILQLPDNKNTFSYSCKVSWLPMNINESY